MKEKRYRMRVRQFTDGEIFISLQDLCEWLREADGGYPDLADHIETEAGRAIVRNKPKHRWKI